MTNAEAQYIVDAIRSLAAEHRVWAGDYRYSSRTNEFTHGSASEHDAVDARVDGWFATIR
jgi:hypothetical protein